MNMNYEMPSLCHCEDPALVCKGGGRSNLNKVEIASSLLSVASRNDNLEDIS